MRILLTTEQVSVVCGELEETGTAVTLELTAEQLITPLAGALTYLRDSSDAYSLITEPVGRTDDRSRIPRSD